MGVDDPRYLARIGGYTANHVRAIDPIECITEAEQQQQTAQAHRRWTEEQRRAWGTARAAIVAAVEGFKASGRLDRRLASDVHVLERGVQRIDRDVGLGK